MIRLLLNRKNILLFMVLLVLNVAGFISSSGTDYEAKDERKSVLAEIKDMNADEAQEYLSNKYINGDSSQEYNSGRQNAAGYVLKHIQYISGYKAMVSSIVENADNMMLVSVFNKQSPESYANIIKTRDDYENIENVELSIGYEDAGKNLFFYKYSIYFCMGMMIIIMYSLLRERQKNVWNLIYATPEGRLISGLKKLIFLIGSSAFIVIIYQTILLITAVIEFEDYSWFYHPVQNISTCQSITIDMSQIEFYIYQTVFMWVVVLGISMAIWLFMLLFREVSQSLIFLGIIIIFEFVLYNKISPQSWLHILREVNVFSLLEISMITTSYKNVIVLGYIMSKKQLTEISLIIAALVSIILSAFCCAYMRPGGREHIFIKKFISYISRLHQVIFSSMPAWIKEMHKILFTCRGYITLIVMLGLAVYFSDFGLAGNNGGRAGKEAVYIEMGGSDYSQLSSQIAESKSKMMAVVARMEEIGKAYEMGEATLDDMSVIFSQYIAASSDYGNYREYEEKEEYLNSLYEERNIKGYMMSDFSYEMLFGSRSAFREKMMLMIIVVGISVILSQTFYLERVTGMEMLLNTGKNGRGRLVLRKLLVAIFIMTVAFAVIRVIDIYRIVNDYGLPYLEAPLQSLTFMREYGRRITIKEYIILYNLARYIIGLGAVAGSFITSKLMQVTKNQAWTILLIIIEVFACWKLG